MQSNIIYSALCHTCDVLDDLSCQYFISGGTLLGARRDRDIIGHDVDFDLDCFSTDEDRILGGVDLFRSKGLDIERKFVRSARNFETLEPPDSPKYSSCLTVLYHGEHIGDIFIYTVFDDGVARRFDFGDGVYSNPKMSLPSWYYSGDKFLEIRGRMFRSVREPELVLEKIYGPDWSIPLKPGEFTSGRNEQSGSVSDADIETLMVYAKTRGWRVFDPDKPVWPQKIQWVGWPGEAGWEWIWRHEPMIREDLRKWIVGADNYRSPQDDIDELFRRKIIAAVAIQSEASRAGIQEVKKKVPSSLLRTAYKLIPLPLVYKEKIKSIYFGLRK